MTGLLVHGGALGDFVLALRIVAVLRRADADRITILGRPGVARLALMSDSVEHVIDLESGGFHRLFVESTICESEDDESLLRGIDLTVNMMAGGAAGDVLSRRLGELTGGRVIDLDPRPRASWRGHVTEQWLHDLKRAGLRIDVGPPRIHVAREACDGARRDWLSGGPSPRPADGVRRRLVVLAPGSGSRGKCWPLERFVQLGQRLAAANQAVGVLLGPVEQERWSAAERQSLSGCGAMRVVTAVEELASAVSAADMYVGNDSGVSHLAAAVGTPTVAIFGPTCPIQWKPLGSHVRIVTSGTTPDAWPSVETVFQSVAQPARSGVNRSRPTSDGTDEHRSKR
ncbi:MAG: glycosyltransferase family 9 protein [Phycisphaerae bacterium]